MQQTGNKIRSRGCDFSCPSFQFDSIFSKIFYEQNIEQRNKSASKRTAFFAAGPRLAILRACPLRVRSSTELPASKPVDLELC